LLLTGSRGGYLSTIASVIVFGVISLWLSRQRGTASFWRIGAVGGAVAVVIAVAVILGIGKNDYLSGRAQNIFETQNMRVDLWRAAIQQWKLAPAFGTGSGTYLYYGRQFRTDRMQVDPVRAHNDYLDLLAEYGCAGAALFLVFLVAHLRNGLAKVARAAERRMAQSRRMLSNGLALQIGAVAAVSAYIVHSAFDFNLHIPANVLLMAFVFGILANPANDRSEKTLRPTWPVMFWRLLPSAIAVIVVVQCIRLIRGEYFAERARTALRRNHAGTTIHLAESALETERKNPNLYDYIGRAQLMRADARTKPDEKPWFYQRALTAFEDGRKLAPLDEDFSLQLGYTYDKLGRFTEAEWMYYNALRLDPRSIWAKHFYQAHLDLWRGANQTPH
jgi:hypothetical protein